MPLIVGGAAQRVSVCGERAVPSQACSIGSGSGHPGRDSYRYVSGDDDFQEELK